MRTILFILFLSLVAEAGMPTWWPETRGRASKKYTELAEVDKRLAEMDQKILSIQEGQIKAMGAVEELKPYLPALKVYLDVHGKEALENIELTRARSESYTQEANALEDFSLDIGAIFKGVMTGDMSTIIQLVLASLGLGGIGYGAKKRTDEKKAKSKAKQFANMDVGASRQAIVADPDFPEVTS